MQPEAVQQVAGLGLFAALAIVSIPVKTATGSRPEPPLVRTSKPPSDSAESEPARAINWNHAEQLPWDIDRRAPV